MNLKEELLDLQSLKGQTRRAHSCVSFCSAVDDMKQPWHEVSGFITDHAPAMAGEQSGLSTLICNKISEEGGNTIKLHCISHQQILHHKFDHVMIMLKTINFICSKALCCTTASFSSSCLMRIWTCSLSQRHEEVHTAAVFFSQGEIGQIFC